jgi:hypothetical protein
MIANEDVMSILYARLFSACFPDGMEQEMTNDD